MFETLRPKKEALTWKKKSCSAVTSIARFDNNGDLIFVWHWYDVYRKRLNMYRDTPYAQIPVHGYAPKREKTHIIYKRVAGTNNQEWIEEEASRNKRVRIECATIATNTRKKLTHHPIQRSALRAFRKNLYPSPSAPLIKSVSYLR